MEENFLLNVELVEVKQRKQYKFLHYNLENVIERDFYDSNCLLRCN